jgi:hypothetical protein
MYILTFEAHTISYYIHLTFPIVSHWRSKHGNDWRYFAWYKLIIEIIILYTWVSMICVGSEEFHIAIGNKLFKRHGPVQRTWILYCTVPLSCQSCVCMLNLIPLCSSHNLCNLFDTLNNLKLQSNWNDKLTARTILNKVLQKTMNKWDCVVILFCSCYTQWNNIYFCGHVSSIVSTDSH